LFGSAIAASGNVALIGAQGAQTSASTAGAGAVYVFVESGGTWTQQQKLTASDGSAGDAFGTSVAISGTTAIIGAPNAPPPISPSGYEAGAAYVFVQSGGTWTQQQKLVCGPQNSGSAVAMAGSDTVFIGAPRLQGAGNATDAGGVCVFARGGDAGAWDRSQTITADGGVIEEELGFFVAASPNAAFFGAWNESGALGATYVATQTTGTWSLTQRLTASDATAADHFGVSGAFDGTTAIIGAPLAAPGGTQRGAAYLFTASGGTWSQTQELVASDGTTGFGWPVAVLGDTALVNGVGVYAFAASGGAWTAQQRIDAPGGSAAGSGWGSALALASPTVALIGASTTTVGANAKQGAVYVEELGPAPGDAGAPEPAGDAGAPDACASGACGASCSGDADCGAPDACDSAGDCRAVPASAPAASGTCAASPRGGGAGSACIGGTALLALAVTRRRRRR
jgi:hypothetical protein